MKKMFLVLTVLTLFMGSSLADGVTFIKMNSDDENSTTQPATMPGTIKLLEFDPVNKNVKRMPDIQAERQKQKELEENGLPATEEVKEPVKLQQMKFDGFTTNHL